MDVSIIIPVYNNEKTLKELNRRLIHQLYNYDFEIIYVDDASEDSSKEVVKEFIEENPGRICLVVFSINQGQQQATWEGLKMASGNRIAVLDADLQDQPERILDLYNMLKGKQGVCFVERIGVYQNWGRMLTSILAKIIVQWITKLRYKAGSFYMMDRPTWIKVLHVTNKINHPYMTIITAMCAEEIHYIKAPRLKADTPSSFTSQKRLKAAYRAIRCSLACRQYQKRSF